MIDVSRTSVLLDVNIGLWHCVRSEPRGFVYIYVGWMPVDIDCDMVGFFSCIICILYCCVMEMGFKLYRVLVNGLMRLKDHKFL